MYAGQIVEVSNNHEFFTAPLHPYSSALMASVPRLRSTAALDFIGGQPPSLINPPTGCRFAARCPRAFHLCKQEPPVYSVDGRQVKCWLYA
jgi:oligopeptide/dipeptide ABC transporter ATP-binding protein